MGPPTRIALLAALISVSAVAAPATAASVRACVPGTASPLCHTWTGKVVSVGDGDTIDVDVFGDGRGFHRVRVTGIQAMELSRYSSVASLRRGACHAREATRRMEQLVLHRRVKLLAQDRGSYTAGRRNRPRRAVLVRRGGRWIDPAAVLVREGHALWLPNAAEWAWNNLYRALTLGAAARKRKLFNRAYCGGGPNSTSAVAMSVRWDADGVDGQNVSGEFGRVRNVGDRPLRIGGWRFRDSYLRYYTIPRATTVRPGRTMTIHVGRGSARAGHVFWGLSAPAFENATRDRRGIGDGAYLFDRDGDLRAWAIYPCASGCAQPRAGSGDGDAEPDRDEDNRGKGKHKDRWEEDDD